jgi:hypothetical protein
MYPVSPGHPDYTDSGSRFIPEIWSGKMLEKLYLYTVFGEISNTDYEGEIKNYGDTVIVRTTPDITINDYVIGQNLTYQRPESTPLEMVIDKGKYYAFACDDIVQKQSDIKLMNDWSEDAGRQMGITIDHDILSWAKDYPHASNKDNAAGADSGDILLGASGAYLQLTKANIMEVIVDCGLVLDEQKIPEQNRWMVLPPWAAATLKKSDLKDASMMGDGTSVLRNGRLGTIDRFTLYSSLNLETYGTAPKTWYAMFGHPMAISFASQMTKTETLRAESTFGDLVRGLNVYGRKVFHPEALGLLWIKK